MKPVCFELACAMKLDDVRDVRHLVEKLHKRFLLDREDVSRLAMAAHELLENAVKFSADGSATLRIEVGDEICVTTRNRARTPDVADLVAIAAELDAAPDPMLFYLGLMKRSPSSRGGLGLGRIAAEGEMKIGFEVDGDVVQVRARSTLARPAA